MKRWTFYVRLQTVQLLLLHWYFRRLEITLVTASLVNYYCLYVRGVYGCIIDGAFNASNNISCTNMFIFRVRFVSSFSVASVENESVSYVKRYIGKNVVGYLFDT